MKRNSFSLEYAQRCIIHRELFILLNLLNISEFVYATRTTYNMIVIRQKIFMVTKMYSKENSTKNWAFLLLKQMFGLIKQVLGRGPIMQIRKRNYTTRMSAFKRKALKKLRIVVFRSKRGKNRIN